MPIVLAISDWSGMQTTQGSSSFVERSIQVRIPQLERVQPG